MGKFEHDGSDVDQTKGGYNGDSPKPGTYNGKLVICEDHTSQAGAEGTHWVFEITDEPYTGWRGHLYTNDEGALWKQDQVLHAIGAIEPGGTYNGTHEKLVKSAAPVRMRLKNETYEGEARAKLQTVSPGGEASSGTSKKKGKKGKKSSEEEPPF